MNKRTHVSLVAHRPRISRQGKLTKSVTEADVTHSKCCLLHTRRRRHDPRRPSAASLAGSSRRHIFQRTYLARPSLGVGPWRIMDAMRGHPMITISVGTPAGSQDLRGAWHDEPPATNCEVNDGLIRNKVLQARWCCPSCCQLLNLRTFSPPCLQSPMIRCQPSLLSLRKSLAPQTEMDCRLHGREAGQPPCSFKLPHLLPFKIGPMLLNFPLRCLLEYGRRGMRVRHALPFAYR